MGTSGDGDPARREFIEASAEKLQALAERRFDDVDLLVIYIDGIRFGEHHVIAAVGVDRTGKKHVLGVRDGASENAAVVTAQTTSAMRAAYRPGPKEGIARLEKLATWLEKEYPSAAASLREGLDETFTVARLGLSSSLLRCLTSTNVIENSHGGLRQKARRVTRWKDGAMVMRWAARIDAF